MHTQPSIICAVLKGGWTLEIDTKRLDIPCETGISCQWKEINGDYIITQ